MTDNEIIKALKCCGISETYMCDEECPMLNNEIRIASDCRIKLNHYALTLISRQQAEIERLKIENQSLRSAANSCKLHYNEARAEAVKEFVENVTYCKYCKNYELMTSNNQHFCNRYGGYVKETDCCSRGYTL